MTKHNKRNRRKSCSSSSASGGNNNNNAETANSGKQEKAAATPRAVVDGSGKNGKNESIRTWFSNLSWQDRATVACIDDTAFISTLLDLASSWSSTHQGAGNKDVKQAWGATFPLERIEEMYKSNQATSLDFVNVGKEMQSSTTANNMASSMMAEVSIPKTTVEEEEEPKNNNTVKDDGDAPPTVDADTFRIRGGQEETTAATKKDEEKQSGAKQGGSETKDNCILEHLRIVFPSVYNIILSHAAFLQDESIGQHATNGPFSTMHNPVVFLDGEYSSEESLCHFDSLLRDAGLNEAFLSEDRYNCWQKISAGETSWIRLLTPLSQKSPDKVSLALMLVTRMEATLMAAYYGDQGKAATHNPSNVAAASETSAGKKAHKPEGGLESQTTTTITPKSSRLSFHAAADAVERHLSHVPSSRSENALKHLLDVVPGQLHAEFNDKKYSLVLIPFSMVMYGVIDERPSKEAPLLSWNAATETAMKALVDVDSSQKANSTKDAAPTLKTASDVTQQSDHDVVDQDGGTPIVPAKKGKKKKKKKKRKVSNADQSHQSCSSLLSESRSSRAEESIGEHSQKKAESKSTTTKARENATDLANGSKTMVTMATQTSPEVSKNDSKSKTNAERKRSDSLSSRETAKSGETTAKAASTPTAGASSVQQEKKPSHDAQDSSDDHSAWETVEAKGRGSRNRRATNGNSRNNDKSNATSAPAQGSSSTGPTGQKKGKKNGRKHKVSRKVARDILASVLDDVDAEVRRRRTQVARSAGTRPILPARLPQTTSMPSQGSAWQARPMTMRDVVLGKLRAEAENAAANGKATPILPVAKKGSFDRTERRSENEASSNAKTPILRNSPKGAWVAGDQQTAPTLPETLSGVSVQSSGIVDGDNASLSGVTSSERVADRNAPTIDYSSSGDIAAFVPAQQSSKDSKKGTSPAPPLQTLLGHGNNNSASSSVASSLEVPHGRLLRRHSSVANENDVGYHLLDVCDRLSRDMDVFMGRRAVALCVRRRERGALLAALQDTATKLWPGRCHVEMYGSCATQLDLPSSDIDTVICGLDRGPPPLQHQMSEDQMSVPRHSGSMEDEMSTSPSVASQEEYQSDSSLHHSYSSHGQHHPYSPGTAKFMHVPALSPNAERVIRLAAELERQPWAVQVKAIPTATVPVVKILADPSRLPGAVAPVINGGDWMMQQHHMAVQAVSSGMNQGPAAGNAGSAPHPQGYYPANGSSAHGTHSHYVHHTPPPWRGADVMNGLFQVDITFEGPEHGGIGSTAYSARFVQDACNEVRQPPDRAPVIQALMVLKELLAQRRLNEPFSGGLSSYALLLLLEAVLKERRAIQREMEKNERQRLVVASSDLNASVALSGGEPRRNDSSQGESDKDRSKELTAKNPQAQKASSQAKSVQAQKTTASTASAKHSGSGKQAQRGDGPSQKGNKTAKPEATTTKKRVVQTKKAPAHSVAAAKTNAPPTPKSGGSSWASIAAATKNTKPAAAAKAAKAASQTGANESKPKPAPKISSFADAVASGGKAINESAPVAKKAPAKADVKQQPPQQQAKKAPETQSPTVSSPSSGSARAPDTKDAKSDNRDSPNSAAAVGSSVDSNNGSEPGFGASSLFPQGSNDVLEVLCSGETTAGKLLLHFLLYYGRHFDSHAMAVDNSGKHHPDAHLVGKRGHHKMHLSPYVPRKGGGSIDPVTGMLTVDPIVVYDPLEGAEDNNVARSCFAWSSIRWVFAQSYMTLSSAVERSGTPPTTPSGNHGEGENGNRDSASNNARADRGSAEESRDSPGDISPLLELLLSF